MLLPVHWLHPPLCPSPIACSLPLAQNLARGINQQTHRAPQPHQQVNPQQQFVGLPFFHISLVNPRITDWFVLWAGMILQRGTYWCITGNFGKIVHWLRICSPEAVAWWKGFAIWRCWRPGQFSPGQFEALGNSATPAHCMAKLVLIDVPGSCCPERGVQTS